MRRILTIWLTLTLVLFAGLALAACDGDAEDAGTDTGVEADDTDADGGADAETDGTAGGAEDEAADDAAGIDAATLVDTKCTQCHDLQRVEQADYDVAGWVDTIERMEGRGLSITEDEKQAVAEYLAAQ